MANLDVRACKQATEGTLGPASGGVWAPSHRVDTSLWAVIGSELSERRSIASVLGPLPPSQRRATPCQQAVMQVEG